MRFFLINIQLIILSFISSAQSLTTWFPSNLNIQPFTANFLEPKAGFHCLLGKSQIRLDIGTSSDIFLYKEESKNISFGADLFTYTRLRGEVEFHFPVEAIDYLFGINAGYKIIESQYEFGLRFRLSHISAHFVDGQFDYSYYDWRNGVRPRVYSREFIELFPFYRINGFRVYLGLTYLFHTTPKGLGKGIYQAGFDYYISSLFNSSITPFAAYDFKISKLDKYFGNNIISGGIKFGKYDSKGLSLLISFYSSMSIHGEYFDRYEKYTTLGINMDL